MSLEFLRSDADFRAMTAADAPAVGQIIYNAIARVFRDHGQPEPIADSNEGERIARLYLDIDPEDGLIVVREGRVVAAGFVHIRDEVASLGPVVVDPDAQGQGLGKLLFDRLSERASRCVSIRIQVDAFNTRAFGIALKRGYIPRSMGVRLVALGRLGGPGMLQAIAPAPVRDLKVEYLEAVAEYDRSAFGGSRERDFRALIAAGGLGLMVEEGSAIRGFLFGRAEGNLAILGPGGADSPDLLGKLLARVGERLTPQANIFLAHLHTTPAEIVREALTMGFRASSLSISMVRGAFEPATRASAITLPPDVV